MDKKPDQWWSGVTYADAKRCIRENIQSLARDYIAIGFCLRRIRDEKQFLEDGYISIHEFAYAEFGMRKSTVNHCIRINAEFSEGGNSPVIDARYKEFGKTQLQELLYVPEDKRDEVTPDMTVAEIREIHRPERLDNEPEQKKTATEQPLNGIVEKEGREELRRNPAKEVEKAKNFTADPITFEENSYGYKRTEIVVEYLKNGYMSASDICEICTAGRMYKVLNRPKVTAFYDAVTGERLFDVENERLEQEYQSLLRAGYIKNQAEDNGAFDDGNEVGEGLEGQDADGQITEIGDMKDNPGQDPDVIDSEYREEPVDITVRDLMDRKQKELDAWIEAMEQDGDNMASPGMEELKIIVQALELLAGQQESHEETETGGRVHEQPPLPVLKNNDQRKEWLGKYQDWGLWYEDGNIGAKYYRYRFENGADLIVDEYQNNCEYAGYYTSSYFHLVGGPKAVQKNGISKWQRHERYSRYPNSETELVEFLKFVQKGGENHC